MPKSSVSTMSWMLFIITCLISISAENKPMTNSCPCVDRAPANKPSSCPQLVHLCSNTVYQKLMMEQCPRTCGRCSGNATSDTCQDKAPPSEPSQCLSLTYLCNNALYRDLMIEQCPKTCCRC
uniref:ShKT domain-containing protein n=1 Tax=Onchocerca volvulus TaxID=6282 RepID=A0A8R1TQY0_ONCVO